MAGVETPSPELVVLVGLQGAGKSTFYRERFAPTHAHVSGDLLPNNRRPARRQQQLVGEALAQGRPVVLDNTNASAAVRAPYLEIARRHRAPAVAYFFTPDLEASLERNAARAGKARVPAVALYATRKKLEPPAFAEGFARIFEVEISSEGGFRVAERSRPEAGPAGPR